MTTFREPYKSEPQDPWLSEWGECWLLDVERSWRAGGEVALAALGYVRQEALQPAWDAGCREILELGCGGGQNLAALKRRGWDVYGVEPNRTGRKLARRNGVQIISARKLGGSTLPLLGEHTFQVVMTCGLLCVLDGPTAARVVEQATALAEDWVMLSEYVDAAERAAPYTDGVTQVYWRPYPTPEGWELANVTQTEGELGVATSLLWRRR